MSIHEKDTGWVVRWRDPAGMNRGLTFGTREGAEAFDERMKEESQHRRAAAAAAAPPTDADEARYNRDFEALLRFGSAHCFWPDPNWRRAMRRRARANGVSIRTGQDARSIESGEKLLGASLTGYEVDRESDGNDPGWAEYREALLAEAAEYKRRNGLKVAR